MKGWRPNKTSFEEFCKTLMGTMDNKGDMQTLFGEGAAWWINELGVQLVHAGKDVEHTTTKSRSSFGSSVILRIRGSPS